MIQVTPKALAAYSEWVAAMHSWSMTVIDRGFMWEVDVPPEAIEASRAGTLRAEITSTYVDKNGKRYRRSRRTSVWIDPSDSLTTFILGDYPGQGDTITLRW